MLWCKLTPCQRLTHPSAEYICIMITSQCMCLSLMVFVYYIYISNHSITPRYCTQVHSPHQNPALITMQDRSLLNLCDVVVCDMQGQKVGLSLSISLAFALLVVIGLVSHAAFSCFWSLFSENLVPQLWERIVSVKYCSDHLVWVLQFIANHELSSWRHHKPLCSPS